MSAQTERLHLSLNYSPTGILRGAMLPLKRPAVLVDKVTSSIDRKGSEGEPPTLPVAKYHRGCPTLRDFERWARCSRHVSLQPVSAARPLSFNFNFAGNY